MKNCYNAELYCSPNIVVSKHECVFDYVAPESVISFTGTAGYFNELTMELVHKYGVTLVVKGITTGKKVTVHGYDYLGQNVTEEFTTAISSAGVKAFKFIEKVIYDGTEAITVETSGTIGLPFSTIEVEKEIINGTKGTVGTLVARNVNTQTATTTDPRGTYVMAGTYVANDNVKLLLVVDNLLDNGGLHGKKHYFNF